MRRALDAARAELASLNDRDAMLDCFFEHSRHLFQFVVLFVVRGDTAHGRNVYGVGAPDGLVTRLTFPVDTPGIFARARELRRPFPTTSDGGEVDARLFGSLGRMMPGGLVVPLVVRDRVVAVLLGDGIAPGLDRRAQEAARMPMELAKEEMLLWAETVSEAFERLILRRKGARGSVPPPGLGGSVRPARPISNWPPPLASTESAIPFSAPPERSPLPDPLFAAPLLPAPPPLSTRRRSLALILAGVSLAGVVATIALVSRGNKDAQRVVLEGPKLRGWPADVDPTAVRGPALGVSGLGDRAELTSIQAEVTRGGHVDFRAPAKNAEGVLLSYRFIKDDTEAHVRVDVDGMHGPRTAPREMCGDKPCRRPVPPPQCSFAQIWESARGAGLGENDRALVTYADVQAVGRPRWTVAALGRGSMALDATSCKPLERQKLRPPPQPLSAIPGAPHAVDPIAILPLARAQTGLEADAVLLEVDARGVRRNGQVDLEERGTAISYTFSDPPSVAGARRVRHATVDASGVASVVDEEDRAPVTTTSQGAAPPPPRCSVVHALEYMTLGDPMIGGTARVTYGPDSFTSESGQWSIDLPSAGLRKTASDLECQAWERIRKD